MGKIDQSKIEEIKKEVREFFELSDNDYIPDPPITIIQTRAEMDEFSDRKTEDWVRATCKEKGIAIISEDVVEQITPHKKGFFDLTLKHELNHWYFTHITGEYNGKPRWFSEGLANYFSGRVMRKPELFNESVVEKYFNFTNFETYRWGYLMVKHLFDHFGKRKVVIFIKKFNNGITQDNFDIKFYEVFGIMPETLEEKVKEEFSTSLEQ